MTPFDPSTPIEFPKVLKVVPSYNQSDVNLIGTDHILPADSNFWSIKNQQSLRTTRDQIVRVKQLIMDSTRGAFVQPMAPIFGVLHPQGEDEWCITLDHLTLFIQPQNHKG